MKWPERDWRNSFWFFRPEQMRPTLKSSGWIRHWRTWRTKMDAGAIKNVRGRRLQHRIRNPSEHGDGERLPPLPSPVPMWRSGAGGHKQWYPQVELSRHAIRWSWRYWFGRETESGLTVSANMLDQCAQIICRDWLTGFAKWVGTIGLVKDIACICYPAEDNCGMVFYLNSLTKIATVLNFYAASMNTLSGYTVTSFGNLK